MEDAIKQIVKICRNQHYDYNQLRYIFKQVRKELNLKPALAKKGTVKRLSTRELETFLNAAYQKDAKTGLMMDCLYQTALRVQEFVDLQPEDLMLEELRIIVQSGKGNKRREVPVSRALMNALQIHLDGRQVGFVFEGRSAKPFTTRRIQQIVKDIDVDFTVTPHVLRHTRATILAEKGMSKDLLQAFLGHEHPETTQIYTNTANLPLEQVFRKIIIE